MDSDFDNILSKAGGNRRGNTNDIAAKGRHIQVVELLSFDSASDDCLRPTSKYSPPRLGTQPATKGRDSTSQGRSQRTEIRNPSRSLESSHLMGYSYEEDTPSIGGKTFHAETTFPKLRWPLDIGGSHSDGGIRKKNDNKDVHCNTEYQTRHEPEKADVDINLEEGDESNDEDVGHNPTGTNSNGEEMPVLPKVPVKRKVANKPRACERRAQRGKPKISSPHTKKQKTPQIDATVITQLEFGKRPQNCVSVGKT